MSDDTATRARKKLSAKRKPRVGKVVVREDDEETLASLPTLRASISKKYLSDDAALEDREYTLPGKYTPKVKQVHAQITEILKEYGPLSVREIVSLLPQQKSHTVILRSLHMMIHTYEVAAFIEAPQRGQERMAFALPSQIFSGLWDRKTLPGFECYQPWFTEKKKKGTVQPNRKAAMREAAMAVINLSAILPREFQDISVALAERAVRIVEQRDVHAIRSAAVEILRISAKLPERQDGVANKIVDRAVEIIEHNREL